MSTQCMGTTIKGIRCTIKTKTPFCRFHRTQEVSKVENKEVITEECCVCCDPINKKLALCGHYIHIECVIKSGKEICPLCRQRVRMTKAEKRLTMDYHDRYRREDIQSRTALVNRNGDYRQILEMISVMLQNQSVN